MGDLSTKITWPPHPRNILHFFKLKFKFEVKNGELFQIVILKWITFTLKTVSVMIKNLKKFATYLNTSIFI